MSCELCGVVCVGAHVPCLAGRESVPVNDGLRVAQQLLVDTVCAGCTHPYLVSGASFVTLSCCCHCVTVTSPEAREKHLLHKRSLMAPPPAPKAAQRPTTSSTCIFREHTYVHSHLPGPRHFVRSTAEPFRPPTLQTRLSCTHGRAHTPTTEGECAPATYRHSHYPACVGQEVRTLTHPPVATDARLLPCQMQGASARHTRSCLLTHPPTHPPCVCLQSA